MLNDAVIAWAEEFLEVRIATSFAEGADPPGTEDEPPEPAPIGAQERPQQKWKTADLGSLSGQYESGKRGSAAIGYDKTGGWSYGKYQIATKTATMAEFLAYLKEAGPEVQKELAAAGGQKGAEAHTDAFVKAWQAAAKDPGFAALEHGFIGRSHYEPGAELLAGAGLDVGKRDKAIRDVTWSVCVQHRSAKLIATALGKLVAAEQARDKKAGAARTRQEIIDAIPDKVLIDAIYDERSATVEKNGKTVMKYFGKSEKKIQDAVAERFKSERKAAQKELADDQAKAKKAAPEEVQP